MGQTYFITCTWGHDFIPEFSQVWILILSWGGAGLVLYVDTEQGTAQGLDNPAE